MLNITPTLSKVLTALVHCFLFTNFCLLLQLFVSWLPVWWKWPPGPSLWAPPRAYPASWASQPPTASTPQPPGPQTPGRSLRDSRVSPRPKTPAFSTWLNIISIRPVSSENPDLWASWRGWGSMKRTKGRRFMVFWRSLSLVLMFWRWIFHCKKMMDPMRWSLDTGLNIHIIELLAREVLGKIRKVLWLISCRGICA